MVSSLPARSASNSGRPAFVAAVLMSAFLVASLLVAGNARAQAVGAAQVGAADRSSSGAASAGGADRSPSGAAAGSVAQTAAGLRLEAILQRALQANPEILAARARVEAAGERPAQARSLPDPMLEGMLRNVGFPGITIGDEMMSQAGVRFSQALPYKGKRDLRGAAAESGVEVAASRLELIRRRVAREVATAYFELEFVDGAIDVVEETRGFLVNLEQTAAARYAVGEGIQQDVLKAQVEISVLLNRLVMLDQMRDTAETRLNRQLDQPASQELARPFAVAAPDWTLSLDDLETQAIASSALLRERARQVEQQEAALAVARSETKPDWKLSSAWMTRGSLPDIWEVNVGINLPIFRSSKQDRATAEAGSELLARQYDHRDATNIVAAAVREAFLRADRAARLTQLYAEVIIPQATLSLESATAGYEVGRVDFLTVLDNVVTLLTYQLEHQRQRADYLQAIVAIEEHVGRSLGVTPASILQVAPVGEEVGNPPTPSEGRSAGGEPRPLAGGGDR